MPPQPYSWPQDARLALSVVVNVEEGAESTVAEGDRGPEPVDELGIALKKPIRNYGNESNYQYGIKAGAPRVLRLLQTHGINATFTAAAVALERAPQLARDIAAQGHETCAHGYRWVHQFHMEEAVERAFIRNAVASIERTTGTRPYGWLSRYLLTANTRRLLAEEGFLYHMDDYSDDQPFWEVVAGKPHRDPAVRARHERHEVLDRPGAVDRAVAAVRDRHVRVAAQGGRPRAADDVDRPAPAHHRPPGTHRRAGALPAARRQPPGRVGCDAARDRAALRRAGRAANGVMP